MGDLVKRLREHERNSGAYTPKYLLGEAAATIEQLQAELKAKKLSANKKGQCSITEEIRGWYAEAARIDEQTGVEPEKNTWPF